MRRLFWHGVQYDSSIALNDLKTGHFLKETSNNIDESQLILIPIKMSKRSDRFTEEEVKLGTENILYCKNKLRIQVYIFTEEGVAYYST